MESINIGELEQENTKKGAITNKVIEFLKKNRNEGFTVRELKERLDLTNANQNMAWIEEKKKEIHKGYNQGKLFYYWKEST